MKVRPKSRTYALFYDIFSRLRVVCSHGKLQKEKVHFKYPDDALKLPKQWSVECCTRHELNCRSFIYIVNEEGLSVTAN